MRLKIKYPKFLLLFVTFVVAYVLLYERDFPLHDTLGSMGLLGFFAMGIFYTYGFTSGPAAVVLAIMAKPGNFLLGGLVAGLGAMAGDLTIFRIIRHSFEDEVKSLSRERPFVWLRKRIPKRFREPLVILVAGFLIASPLPDEIGVTMLASYKVVSSRLFYVISYGLNTTGILVLMFLGSAI